MFVTHKIKKMFAMFKIDFLSVWDIVSFIKENALVHRKSVRKCLQMKCLNVSNL